MRKAIKTTKKQIVEWGQSNIDECGYGVDASEMATHCWRCGHDDRTLERAHVIPDSLEGEDTPSNYRLLCNPCHQEAPNVNDPNAMDKWIRETCIGAYNRFWPMREILQKVSKETSVHFGHNGSNLSTTKWMINKIKDLYFEKFYPNNPERKDIPGWHIGLFPKKYLI